MDFLRHYSEATLTSLGFFWTALWAFVLGYAISAMIQAFVTRERMRRTMGGGDEGADLKSVGLGTFFGFISSSCSFAALATTKSLFQKGAGFIPSLAFLLSSTNLVIELGIIIAIFLGWQFVVGEYIGAVLLVALMWGIVRLTKPRKLIQKARERMEDEGEGGDVTDWRKKITSLAGWREVAQHYFMEWGMVWKDVTFGFTVAGIIAAFVPKSFFQTLFVGSGGDNAGFLAVVAQTLIGPVAAFFTFIGSMGNIPLAALLFGNGVSFAGVMAFIFSDLVVFPVLRINAKYYGWKMALYILAVLLAALVSSALLLHYGFALVGLLPQNGGQSTAPTERFAFDYTFFLNLAFLGITGVFAWLHLSKRRENGHTGGGKGSVLERILFWLALASYAWLAGGLFVTLFV